MIEDTTQPGCSDLRSALDQAGWRFTRQRAAVYEYLHKAQNHPTAEEVYLAVRQQIPNISLATVYKALEALVDSRLITKLTNVSGPARYDHRCDPHYHIRCEKTGEVHDLDISFDPHLLEKLDPSLIDSLRRRGFEVTGYRLEVIGNFSDSGVPKSSSD
ncbi:MAG: transcriptional repressor [Gemmatales bacterium]|nr:MAG: transcriptional repressor [Gemmatales bacterium]